MTRKEFFELCDQAKGEIRDIYSVSGRNIDSLHSVILFCDTGFNDKYVPKLSRWIVQASRQNVPEVVAKYQRWLEQYREQKHGQKR